jgi:hypothetical protein
MGRTELKAAPKEPHIYLFKSKRRLKILFKNKNRPTLLLTCLNSNQLHSSPTLPRVLSIYSLTHITYLDNKIIREVTLSFTPHPLFQWYLQSKEILLNLQ